MWVGAAAITATAVLGAGHILPSSSEPARQTAQLSKPAGQAPAAALQRSAGRQVAEARVATPAHPDSRGARVFHRSAGGHDAASDLAPRGGRVFEVAAATPASKPAAKRHITWLHQNSGAPLLRDAATRPIGPDGEQTLFARAMFEPSDGPGAGSGAGQQLAALGSRPAGVASADTATSEASADPKPAEAMRVASLDPRAGGLAGPDASPGDDTEAASNVPLPSFRDTVADDISAEVAKAEPDPATVAVPVPRPRAPASAGRQVASLEPRDVGRRAETATDATAAVEAARPRQRPAKNVPAALAYARQSAPGEDGSDNGGGVGSFFSKLFNSGPAQLPAANSKVAVYDIQSATVYLPGDKRLEAHSGLGHMQDNPRYVNQKNRGPTPPNIYNMVMRESLFHGVQAIRLLPADGRKKFNRDGLLAHSYMYVGGGDRSQSNGCVVFKNYDQFLREFKRGHINRLIVVKSLDDLPTYMAAL